MNTTAFLNAFNSSYIFASSSFSVPLFFTDLPKSNDSRWFVSAVSLDLSQPSFTLKENPLIDPDWIVIGSGLGGLSAAAVLQAQYGQNVHVLESHNLVGGCAHSFTLTDQQGRRFAFDSGPSLFSGLSYRPSNNPLAHVLDLAGVTQDDLQFQTYRGWGLCLPEGNFYSEVGENHFKQNLAQLFPKDRAANAIKDFEALQHFMKPLADASIAIPPVAIRLDPALLLTAAKMHPRKLFSAARNLPFLLGPFSKVLQFKVSDPFVYRWFDMLCFLLSGLNARGTITAEVAFMFQEWYQSGVCLDYPKGGSAAIPNALVAAFKRNGGHLSTSAHVEEIIIEEKSAVGVRLKSGKVMRAKRGIISNADSWQTFGKLIRFEHLSTLERDQRMTLPMCDSFMHLHLGFDTTGLQDLHCHYLVVNTWDNGVDAESNMVLISIPSVLDPSLAPANYASAHVYSPGNEKLDKWRRVKYNSAEYRQLKQERIQFLWKAMEKIIPDIRARCTLIKEGTPLTHQRFLNRTDGTYGPAIEAGKAVFPQGQVKSIKGLYCTGDSTFPGIGVPAVAASGLIVANQAGDSIKTHLSIIDKILGT